jgi:hypothetical protein
VLCVRDVGVGVVSEVAQIFEGREERKTSGSTKLEVRGQDKSFENDCNWLNLVFVVFVVVCFCNPGIRCYLLLR